MGTFAGLAARASVVLRADLILVLYDIAELVGASGAITILQFGVVLGNMEALVWHLATPVRRLIEYERNQAEFALDTFLGRLNEELAFLLQTCLTFCWGLFLISRP